MNARRRASNHSESLLSRLVTGIIVVCIMVPVTERYWGPAVRHAAELPEVPYRSEDLSGYSTVAPAPVEPLPQRTDSTQHAQRSPQAVEPTPDPAVTARQARFMKHARIDDAILLRVYEEADTSGNGRLEMAELQRFQRWVYQGFRYENNPVALAPHLFGANGGGDCDDFALYTCGLLEYWGQECWIGVIEGPLPTGGSGVHAVALLTVGQIPPGMEGFVVEPVSTFPQEAWGTAVIPIDYDRVGGYTNATPSPGHLTAIYEPVSTYGWRM